MSEMVTVSVLPAPLAWGTLSLQREKYFRCIWWSRILNGYRQILCNPRSDFNMIYRIGSALMLPFDEKDWGLRIDHYLNKIKTIQLKQNIYSCQMKYDLWLRMKDVLQDWFVMCPCVFYWSGIFFHLFLITAPWFFSLTLQPCLFCS